MITGCSLNSVCSKHVFSQLCKMYGFFTYGISPLPFRGGTSAIYSQPTPGILIRLTSQEVRSLEHPDLGFRPIEENFTGMRFLPNSFLTVCELQGFAGFGELQFSLCQAAESLMGAELFSTLCFIAIFYGIHCPRYSFQGVADLYSNIFGSVLDLNLNGVSSSAEI